MINIKEANNTDISYKDGNQLLEDIKKWQTEYFVSMGVIGLNTEEILLKYLKHNHKHTYVYHFQNTLYLTIMTDISFTEFDTICNELKEDYKKLYSAYSDEEPEPEKMIRQIMKRLQVNRESHAILENNLLTDIKAGNYPIYLQPKKNCITKEIIGAEALIRYQKNSVILPPSKFIEEFERNGLISDIDLYMFEEVCRLLKNWSERKMRIYPISLNFSRVTLMDDHLLQKMNEIQELYGVNRNLLDIEVTESVGEMDKQLLERIGKEISDNGYKLSLDDFGVRYSNVALLVTLPFNSLKLDKSIIQNLVTNYKIQLMVKNLIQLCNQLHVEFIAEGIETKEQEEYLMKLGCNLIQGYLVSKPLDVKTYEWEFQ